MAFGRGGNGNRGGILRHWKLILGILVVLAGAAVILLRGRINHMGRAGRQSAP